MHHAQPASIRARRPIVETRLIIAYALLAFLMLGAIVSVLQLVRYQRDLKRIQRGRLRPGQERKPFWL